jgi:tetratricopeptide (TPR) repeat protein
VDRRNFLRLAASTPLVVPLAQVRDHFDVPLRRQLPPADLDHWQEVVADHAAAYATTPPARLLEAMTPDLTEISALANRYPHQRPLQVTAARACGLTGALHTDLEDAEAEDWLRTAAGYARLAEDAPMRTWVAMARAMDAYYTQRPRQVVRIADQARRSIGDGGGAALVQLTGLAARAHSAQGDADSAHDALESATELHAEVSTEDADTEFFGFPARQLTMYASSVYSHTGDDRAWDTQDEALEHFGDDPLSQTVILLERAEYVLERGDIDQAASIATNALDALNDDERIPLLLGQAHHLADRLDEHSPEAAADFRHHLT